MTKDEFNNTAFNGHLADHKLMGARCEDCGALYLPPRPMCKACFGKQMTWVEMSGVGKLSAFTAIHIAPTAMIEAGYGRNNPYLAGIIQLEEGRDFFDPLLDIAPEQHAAIGGQAARDQHVDVAELPGESEPVEDRPKRRSTLPRENRPLDLVARLIVMLLRVRLDDDVVVRLFAVIQSGLGHL